MPTASIVTASFVTRELDFGSLDDWSDGDRATQAFFAPVETYEARFGALLDDIVDLGYSTIDLWGAHLHYEWATDRHFEIARSAFSERGIVVNSIAAWCQTRSALEGFCRVANEVGAGAIAGGSPLLTADREYAVDTLAEHEVVFAIENHPEASPAQVIEAIGASEWIGSCPDTGWWAIQGYDPPTAIRELAGTIVTVHLKDVDAATGKGRRPGSGDADVAGCLAALSDIHYDGAVGIEHEPDGWDPADDLRHGYEMLRDWIAGQ